MNALTCIHTIEQVGFHWISPNVSTISFITKWQNCIYISGYPEYKKKWKFNETYYDIHTFITPLLILSSSSFVANMVTDLDPSDNSKVWKISTLPSFVSLSISTSPLPLNKEKYVLIRKQVTQANPLLQSLPQTFLFNGALLLSLLIFLFISGILSPPLIHFCSFYRSYGCALNLVITQKWSNMYCTVYVA